MMLGFELMRDDVCFLVILVFFLRGNWFFVVKGCLG